MKKLNHITEKLETLFDEINNLKNINGNIIGVKYDGGRNDNYITVFLSNVKNNVNIKYEGDDLKVLLVKLLNSYYELQIIP